MSGPVKEDIMKSLCGLTASEIAELGECNEKHSLAIANWLYKSKPGGMELIPDVPRKLKEKLKDISFPGVFAPVSSIRSADGTVKFLFRNESGQEFETFLLRDEKRTTVCVSSQSGCRMGCPFCATGKYGFRGNLSVRDSYQVLQGKPKSLCFHGMGAMDNRYNVLNVIMTASCM